MKHRPLALALALAVTPVLAPTLVAGCSSSDSSTSSSSSSGTTPPTEKTDEQYKADVTTQMHAALLADLDTLVKAAEEMQAAAPAPKGRGWDKAQDAAAIESMRTSWKKARTAYEHIEGAIAPLFPDVDFVIDARYDDYLAELKDAGDPNPFDDQNVTGMHAIERIIFSDTAPPYVLDFEKTLKGYKAPAFPATEQEAADFKTKLCARLVTDTKNLRDQWQPQKIDLAGAFQGLVALMREQQEKVNKASTNEEESRYAQRTLADLKANLEGTRAIYKVFQPWIVARKKDALDGKAIDAKIQAGFAALDAAYAATPGDGIPQPPATWSAENPSAADLQTPFGKLYSKVHESVDPKGASSVVAQMNDAARLLGFPELAK